MIFNPEAILEAFTMVLTWKCLYWLIIGVVIGVGVGAMPGLTASTGVALMIPLTFTMSTANALALLIGLYKGAVYGGSISAISFATPGTPEAAATIYDGHKMMQRGQGRKAALMALYSSITADTLSDVITIVLAPALALVALTESALDMWWKLASIFSGGMVGLFLLGMISRRAGNPAGLTAVLIGGLVIVWMVFSPTDYWPETLEHLKSPFHSFMIIVVGTLSILLVGLLVSRFTPARPSR